MPVYSEKKRSKKTVVKSAVAKQEEKSKHQSQQDRFNIDQLLTMSDTQLVKQFSLFSKNKNEYSYSCALVPECNKKYTSFDSECKARTWIESHLAEHLKILKSSAETCK